MRKNCFFLLKLFCAINKNYFLYEKKTTIYVTLLFQFSHIDMKMKNENAINNICGKIFVFLIKKNKFNFKMKIICFKAGKFGKTGL